MRIECVQHLLRPRAHGDIVRQVHPANRAGGINQKLGRPRDVVAFRPPAGMQEIVTANDFGVRIGKQRKGETQLLRCRAINLRRVDADGDDANAARVEIGKTLLKTPQLGVTEWSPEPAIKN